MKAAVISDIHANLDALDCVIAHLSSYDEIICLGDIVGYGPQPNEVVETLHDLQPDIVLMGNHDNAVVTGNVSGFSSNAAEAVRWTRLKIKKENLEYLSNLKPFATTRFEETAIALFHGSPKDPLNEYVFPGISNNLVRRLIHDAGSNVVLLGHTHMPMVYSTAEGLVANPGSVGQPRDGDPRACHAIMQITDGQIAFKIKRTEYEIELVARKIEEAGLPRFLAERLYIGV